MIATKNLVNRTGPIARKMRGAPTMTSYGSPYSSEFYEGQSAGSRSSARVVISKLNDLIGPPHSVVDVGCGVGTWLAEFKESGVREVRGIDGPYVRREDLQIEASEFQACDFSQAFPSLSTRYGMALSVEVAEHLPEELADSYVSFLSGCSDTVVFSAAVPGQGGTHHVNEQWPKYWIDKFSSHGLEAFDLLRPTLWNDSRVEFWYRQNLFILARGQVAETLRRVSADEMPLNVIHPDGWMLSRTAKPSLRDIWQAVRQFPEATIGSGKKVIKKRRR